MKYEEWKKEQFGQWFPLLEDILDGDNFDNILEFLSKEYDEQIIVPRKEDLFRVFQITSPQKVKVIIIGQDPYIHEKEGHIVANGIAFGTDISNYIPESLQNIYLEILRSYDKEHIDIIDAFHDYSLTSWCTQGILLLNSTPTTRLGISGAHQEITVNGKFISWQKFIGNIITKLVQNKNKLVFILMGSSSHELSNYITNDNETYTIYTSHPAKKSYKKTGNPLFGSDFAIKTNQYLKNNKKPQIIWFI